MIERSIETVELDMLDSRIVVSNLLINLTGALPERLNGMDRLQTQSAEGNIVDTAGKSGMWTAPRG